MDASAALPLHLNGEYFGPVEADMASQIISDSGRVCAICSASPAGVRKLLQVSRSGFLYKQAPGGTAVLIHVMSVCAHVYLRLCICEHVHMFWS